MADWQNPDYGYGLADKLGGYGTGIGAGIAALMAKNPATDAMGYLNQIPGTISPYYNPYINAGQQSLQQQQGQYDQLLNDPGQRMNQIGQSFQQSPGYQFQVDQAQRAATNAAAAGGMAGSGQHQQIAAQTINDLANQDYYNYLGKALGLYGQGLQGSQGLGQLGYGAASGLASSLADNLNSKSNLAYASQVNQNQEKGKGWGSLLGAVGGIGGSILGGPVGGTIGSSLGKWLGG